MWHSAGASVGQFKIHVNDNLGQLTYIYWERSVISSSDFAIF